MDSLKLSYELDRLEDIVEERVRLTSVLKIQPSSKDNVSLKQQLSKTLDLLNEFAKTSEVDETSKQFSARYNEISKEIPDKIIDLSLYEFQLPEKRQSSEDSSDTPVSRDLLKRVRFKDEELVTYDKSEEFKPYHDEPQRASDEDATDTNNRKKLFPQTEPATLDATLPSLSNQELFIQQQQQLFEQDTYLNSLSESVRKSHDISLDINHEVSEQNTQVLQDLESLVDNSGRNLDRAKRRLEAFEKTARDNGPCFIILLLIMILLLLLIAL